MEKRAAEDDSMAAAEVGRRTSLPAGFLSDIRKGNFRISYTKIEGTCMWIIVGKTRRWKHHCGMNDLNDHLASANCGLIECLCDQVGRHRKHRS